MTGDRYLYRAVNVLNVHSWMVGVAEYFFSFHKKPFKAVHPSWIFVLLLFCSTAIKKKIENKNYLWDLNWKFQTNSMQSPLFKTTKNLSAPSSLIGDVLVLKQACKGLSEFPSCFRLNESHVRTKNVFKQSTEF